MDKDIFSTLPPRKRFELLLEKGVFLATVKYYKFKANLYALNSFFVEILCYQGSTEIERIEVASEAKLAKYMNRIKIESLTGIDKKGSATQND
jgi:hypothetical protein